MLKMKRCKRIYHANINQKKAGVAILISNKEDFRTRNITRDKGRHLRMTKGSVCRKDVILNV